MQIIWIDLGKIIVVLNKSSLQFKDVYVCNKFF